MEKTRPNSLESPGRLTLVLDDERRHGVRQGRHFCYARLGRHADPAFRQGGRAGGGVAVVAPGVLGLNLSDGAWELKADTGNENLSRRSHSR